MGENKGLASVPAWPCRLPPNRRSSPFALWPSSTSATPPPTPPRRPPTRSLLSQLVTACSRRQHCDRSYVGSGLAPASPVILLQYSTTVQSARLQVDTMQKIMATALTALTTNAKKACAAVKPPVDAPHPLDEAGQSCPVIRRWTWSPHRTSCRVSSSQK